MLDIILDKMDNGYILKKLTKPSGCRNTGSSYSVDKDGSFNHPDGLGNEMDKMFQELFSL